METDAKIYVAGHNGLVGSALMRRLEMDGYTNIIARTSSELDLTRQAHVDEFFREEKPDYVFLAVGKRGGVVAEGACPARFIYKNLAISSNVINASYENNVTKLLNLGSNCIYPKNTEQPLKEEQLLAGELEPPKETYAIAKIAPIKLCSNYNEQYGTDFMSVVPTNLYGPNDGFGVDTPNLIPSLIRKLHDAKVNNESFVSSWGTGAPRREFLHVYDLADSCVYLMQNKSTSDIGEFVNIGTGEEISNKELADTVKDIVGFEGTIEWDTSKPDGTPGRLLDVSRIHDLGWHHAIGLKEGIENTYEWYLSDYP